MSGEADTEKVTSNKNVATVTFKSNSTGKWGSDQARQKHLRSHNQERVSELGMLRVGRLELGLHPAPDRLRNPVFQTGFNYYTISWEAEIPFWEYPLTCAKNLTLTIQVSKKIISGHISNLEVILKAFSACSAKSTKNQISFLFTSVTSLWYAPSCPGGAPTLSHNCCSTLWEKATTFHCMFFDKK